MRKILHSNAIPNTDMPASHGIRTNDWVFLSGMAGLAENASAEASFEEQAKLTMDRLSTLAAEADITMDELVKCCVYLKDMKDLAAFDKVYASYFKKGVFPARYVFEMPSLLGAGDVLVEAIGRKVTEEKNAPVSVMIPEIPTKHPASHALKSGNFVFVSAVPPADYENAAPAISFEDQIRGAARNMIRAVELAGGKKENIVKVVIYMKDLDLFDHFNSIYREFFDKDKNPPARSCFGVTSFDGVYDVAMECVAYLGEDRVTLRSDKVPAYNLPFCQGIRAEDMVFVSGQVGCWVDRGMPEGFEDQMNAVFNNMFSVAKEAGAGPDDFVRTTGYLVNEEDYEEFKRLYRPFWKSHLPASVIFKVAGISYDYFMEIDSHVVLPRE